MYAASLKVAVISMFNSPLAYFYQKLTHPDGSQQELAANTLQNWEATIVMLRDQHYQPDAEQSPGPLAHSRIQLHYALNNCFLADQPLLESIESTLAKCTV